jgi:selenide,water dikinase
MEAFSLLPDPQTNGGLLFSVADAHKSAAEEWLHAQGLDNIAQPIGRFTSMGEKMIQVRN